MGQPLRRILFLLGLLLAAAHAGAAPPGGGSVALDDPAAEYPLGLQLAYFADHDQRCPLDCARQRFARGDTTRSDVAAPNLGLTGSYWFRFAVTNHSLERDWVLEVDAPYLDDVQLYARGEHGTVTRLRSGDMLPGSSRPLRDRNIAFPLPLATGEATEVLLRVTNEGPVTVPLALQSRHEFEAESARENLVYGVYFGILLGIALYNLMLYFAMRDRNNLYYVLYIASFGLTMATVYGYGNVYLWPESPWWGNRSVPISVVTTGFLVILFARRFLSLDPHDIRHRTMTGLLVLLPMLLPLAAFAPFGIAVRIIYVIVMVCSLWLMFIGLDQVLRGNRSARYFMLAWAVLLGSTAAFLLTKLGVLPSVFLTEYGILIGSGLEAILLSLALAHRFALIREQNVLLQADAKAELQRAVEERTRELDQALRARSEFLATVSHEIRTPMNGVLGITELLLDTDLTPRQKEYARIIQDSGRTLLTIINDVLDYSKIEAGKMTLEHVPFRVLEVLNSAIRIFHAEAERKKLRFVTAIDPDVPPEILGDPVRLQQVLNNLLSNAMKFTEEGEIRLTVHREDDGKLTFSVADTGIGIDMAKQARLFDAFDQGDQSMTRRYGGTGLGLAISRRLIALMGGSISFESSIGHGTTFYFTIPVRVGGSGTFRKVEPAGTPARASLHLLVVDDNAVNLQVAAGLLRKLGHRADTVGGGAEAIACRFADGPAYDAILMDCEMPGMDGYSATRAIRAQEAARGLPRLPVIALTAHAFPEKIQACHDAGMDDHLAKPLNVRLLEQALARVPPRAG